MQRLPASGSRLSRPGRFAALFLLLAATPILAQRGTTNGEWRAWGGDLGVTRYAPLDQINAANFNTLQIAWRFRTDNLGKRPDFNLQTVPLMIKGVLYATAGEHRNAVAIISQYKIGPIFTPPITRGYQGKQALLFVPNGANWPGGALDPDTNILYVFSHTLLRLLSLVNDPKRSDMNYISVGGGDDAGGGAGLTVQGLPIVKPPWGRITALDLNKGEIVWQIAHGDTPDAVKNHPALKGLTLPRTGRTGGAGGSSGGIGTLVTKTLVIAGEGGTVTTPNGLRGAMLRAYDKATGAEVGAVHMPGAQTGSPMTYMLNGKQYIVLGVSSLTMPGELIAYTLQ